AQGLDSGVSIPGSKKPHLGAAFCCLTSGKITHVATGPTSATSAVLRAAGFGHLHPGPLAGTCGAAAGRAAGLAGKTPRPAGRCAVASGDLAGGAGGAAVAAGRAAAGALAVACRAGGLASAG